MRFYQHCKRTKDLLQELHIEMEEGWSYDVVDLDLMPEGDGPKLQAELADMTVSPSHTQPRCSDHSFLPSFMTPGSFYAQGQRTVPNIFVGGDHVGGNSDLQAMHAEDKALEPRLRELADAHEGDL
jgi:glutaredoxin 3